MQNSLASTADVTALQAVIAALRQENEYLLWQLAKARRERFGRRSERGDLLNQLSLYPEESIEVCPNRCPAKSMCYPPARVGSARPVVATSSPWAKT